MHIATIARCSIAHLAAAGIAVPLLAGEPATGLAPPAATPSAIAAPSPAAEVLALEQERYDRMTIPVQVDGHGPYAFMIDTGSQATVVSEAIRTAHALPKVGNAILVGMASRRPVELVEVSAIEFGRNRVETITTPVLAAGNVGADGIIGLDLLQDLRVLIDFRQQTMSVEPSSQVRRANSGFEIVVRARERFGQLLITDAMVEGVRATVIIDTGAQTSLGNLALRDRIRARRAREVVTTDVNGVNLIGEMALVRNLAIEGLALSNVPLTFADTPAFAALGMQHKPTLAIGMQHLALFDRVAIDFARRRVLFDVPQDLARALREARRPGTWSQGF